MRLRLLAGALLAVGLATAAHADRGGPVFDNKDRVFVTNRDGSVSLVQRVHGNGPPVYRESERVDLGIQQMDWPANQYEGKPHWWWIGVSSGHVWGFNAPPNQPLADIQRPENQMMVAAYTNPGVPAGLPVAGSNFSGGTPNGKAVWNAAREIDRIQEIDADPHSPTFGQVVFQVEVPLSAKASTPSSTRGAMRPCDMSITPNGKFLFEPDLGGETVTAVDIKNRRIAGQLLLEPVTPGTRVSPFMLTTNGKIALVENLEGNGTYAVIDVTDPANMREIKRLTQADGIGFRPQTSEFSKDGRFAYLIANGTPSIPGVISVFDLDTLTVSKNIALPANCGPFAGDFSNDGKHFFVACSTANSVAVIDTRAHEVIQEVAISGANPVPRGVVVR